MSAAAPSTVLWLPSHPSMGAASMDRYWRELERERRVEGVPDGLRIVSPLGNAPVESRRGGRLKRAWQKYAAYPWLASRAAGRRGMRVVHVLDHSFAHLLARVPARGVFKVATIHDLAPLRDGGDLTAGQRERFRRTVGHLRRADLVLADSRHSADEAVELLHLAPERMRVLPLGVDAGRFALRGNDGQAVPPWRQALAGRKVVLSVGAAIGRKNLQVLPAVFRELKTRAPHPGVAFLRVGHPLPAALREELHAVLGTEGFVELGLAPDDDLVAAYQHADALLFPSRIEGFGFPVLEAMAAGCPVVCTNVTSLPEVGGEAALYFGPDEPAVAAAHLRCLFNDEAFRSERAAQGRAQAALFSWRRHYLRLLDLYRIGSLPSGESPVAEN